MDGHQASGQQPMFLTDDQIARELQLVENALADLAASIPSLRRKIAALRQQLAPEASAAETG